MYTGLTDIDQEGNIVPGIAESWESNKELTSWVFRLRKGVLFHNGREVDAEAVEFIPIKSLAAKGSGAPGNCAGHSRVPSPDRGRPPSTGGSGLSRCDSA